MAGKLTAAQRRAVFLRWVEGNRLLCTGGVPETMREIGARYGITPQAVAWIVRDLGGQGNRRPSGHKPGRCCETGCTATAHVRGRCRPHYERRQYRENPEFRARMLRAQADYRARRAGKMSSTIAGEGS